MTFNIQSTDYTTTTDKDQSSSAFEAPSPTVNTVSSQSPSARMLTLVLPIRVNWQEVRGVLSAPTKKLQISSGSEGNPARPWASG